jgi:hypothetical protein
MAEDEPEETIAEDLPEGVVETEQPEHEEEDGEQAPLTSGDFHTIAQKQILNAVFAILADTKMDWALVAPFLEAAREICVADFEETGRMRLHTTRAEGEAWVDAEEAYVGLSVSDRDDHEEWLSETFWLSEMAIADGDAAEVKRIVDAIERSLVKIRAWLAEHPQGGG